MHINSLIRSFNLSVIKVQSLCSWKVMTSSLDFCQWRQIHFLKNRAKKSKMKDQCNYTLFMPLFNIEAEIVE